MGYRKLRRGGMLWSCGVWRTPELSLLGNDLGARVATSNGCLQPGKLYPPSQSGILKFTHHKNLFLVLQGGYDEFSSPYWLYTSFHPSLPFGDSRFNILAVYQTQS